MLYIFTIKYIHVTQSITVRCDSGLVFSFEELSHSFKFDNPLPSHIILPLH